MRLTDELLAPLPKPKEFESTPITRNEAEELLNKHPEITSIKGKNGVIKTLLLSSFDHGLPFLQNTPPLNNQFKEELVQLLTVIKQAPESEQKILLTQLKNGFMDCQPGMQRCVSEMLAEQRSFEFGFEEQVKVKINEYKMQMLEELILERHPTAYTNKTSYFQMTHLNNQYKVWFSHNYQAIMIEKANSKDKFSVTVDGDGKIVTAYVNNVQTPPDQIPPEKMEWLHKLYNETVGKK